MNKAFGIFQRILWCLLLFFVPANAKDSLPFWPQFRGPNGSGVDDNGAKHDW